MAVADPDAEAASGLLVAQPEAVAAVSLALALWEADPAALALPGLRVLIGSKGATEVDSGLLEHLR